MQNATLLQTKIAAMKGMSYSSSRCETDAEHIRLKDRNDERTIDATSRSCPHHR